MIFNTKGGILDNRETIIFNRYLGGDKVKRRILGFILVAFFAVAMFPVFGQAEAAGLKLNKSKATLKIGGTVQLKLKGAAGAISWKSEDKKVATVSDEGLVKGKAAGSTRIKATFNGKKYYCSITVSEAKINYQSNEIYEGATFKLKVTGAVISTFTSSDKDVAKVTKKGNVTGTGIGEAVITAKDKAGNTYNCTVKVVLDPNVHVHTVAVLERKLPTCTETGLTEGEYCTTCGEILKAQESVPAKGHVPDAKGICVVCGQKDPTFVAEHTHHLVNESKEPTCTEAGYTDRVYCDICGEVFLESKVIKALGHDFHNGYCKRCGEKEEHEWITEKGYAATCTKPGKTDYIYCKYCKKVKQKAETIPALGHEYGNGSTCIRCGADKNGHVHTWVNQAYKAPTCTQPGLTEGKYCSTCGRVEYAQGFIPALGHNFVNGKCTRCGASEK